MCLSGVTARGGVLGAQKMAPSVSGAPPLDTCPVRLPTDRPAVRPARSARAGCRFWRAPLTVCARLALGAGIGLRSDRPARGHDPLTGTAARYHRAICHRTIGQVPPGRSEWEPRVRYLIAVTRDCLRVKRIAIGRIFPIVCCFLTLQKRLRGTY